jgi:hypothetical protein
MKTSSVLGFGACTGLCLALVTPATGNAASFTGVKTAAKHADSSITVTYPFAHPDVDPITIDGVAYDRVTMPGAPNCGEAGEPALPACGATILLPYGTDVRDIRITTGDRIVLDGTFRIEPAGRPVRLSDAWGEIPAPTPNPDIYGANQAFPSAVFEEIGTHAFRGYRMLTLKLQPMRHNPVTGELAYFTDLTVHVDVAPTRTADALYRGRAADDLAVRSMVDNPDIAAGYPQIAGARDKSYDLLILTLPTLTTAFQPLADYHNAHGIPTEIHTTLDFGSTDPANVRNYIIDRYQNDGIQYVIIGGDDDVLPAQNLYVEAWSGGDVETAMPGDIYFGCLEGSWNNDGDGYFGETNDGVGGGDVDMVAEVYIGRACVGNATEATRFVDKTIGYLTGQHGHTENVLMVGEYLGFGGVSDYAGNMMDQNVDGSSADGYTTVGIPSDVYTVDTMYERDGSWSKSDLAAEINGGLHILNHLGHGSPDYAMKFYNSDVLSLLSNTDHCFVYSQTCLAGHFDGTECWAETMNVKTDAGAFAVVMNARYGWGSSNSTDGPSQRFNREFWDAVFNPGEAMPQLGPANHGFEA